MSTQNTDPNNPNNRDFQQSINARPATNDELAYRDAYVQGKVAEQREQDRRRALDARIYQENARLRADNGVSTGLVLGLVLAAVAAVIGGALYVYSDAGDGSIVAPVTPEATTPEPASDTTIIERTIERTQEVVPAPSDITLPDVNVNVTPPPAPQPNPAPEAVEPTTAPVDGEPASPEAQPEAQPQ
jgi:hypothetical protein